MYCHRAQRLLSAYVDGELSGHEMLAVRGHLHDCPECRQYHERLALMKRMLSLLPYCHPTAGSLDRLGSLLHDPTHASRRGIREILEEWRYAYRRPAWMAGIAAGFAMGLILLASPSHDPTPGQTAAMLQDYLNRNAAYRPVQLPPAGGPMDVLSSEARLQMVDVGYFNK